MVQRKVKEDWKDLLWSLSPAPWYYWLLAMQPPSKLSLATFKE